MSMDWTKERCIEFVEDYRSLSCLWKTSDPFYKDRGRRAEAQRYLADKYNLHPAKAVNNKIKSFRSYFHRLHAESKKKTLEDGVLSEPTWFLYKHLLFILEGEENGDYNRPSPEPEYTEEDIYTETQEYKHFLDIGGAKSEETSNSSIPASQPNDDATSDDLTVREPSIKLSQFDTKPDSRPLEDAIGLLRNVTELMRKRDHIAAFAEHVEGRIRNMKEPRLQAAAQMRIQTVLYEMELEQTQTGGAAPHWSAGNLKPANNHNHSSSSEEADASNESPE